jgi:hypothetical protein
VLFVGVTAYVLESGGVGIVATRQADGEERSTHVWPARIDGVLWLEAGTPENGWYVDVQSTSEVWLDYEGVRAKYRAVPVLDVGAQRRLRAAIHDAFGWRDSWVGIWVDSGGSIAVRLDPLD